MRTPAKSLLTDKSSDLMFWGNRTRETCGNAVHRRSNYSRLKILGCKNYFNNILRHEFETCLSSFSENFIKVGKSCSRFRNLTFCDKWLKSGHIFTLGLFLGGEVCQNAVKKSGMARCVWPSSQWSLQNNEHDGQNTVDLDLSTKATHETVHKETGCCSYRIFILFCGHHAGIDQTRYYMQYSVGRWNVKSLNWHTVD